jgi:hypothetical protein
MRRTQKQCRHPVTGCTPVETGLHLMPPAAAGGESAGLERVTMEPTWRYHWRLPLVHCSSCFTDA